MSERKTSDALFLAALTKEALGMRQMQLEYAESEVIRLRANMLAAYEIVRQQPGSPWAEVEAILRRGLSDA